MADGGDRIASYSPVEVDIKPDPKDELGLELLFEGMHAEETLGQPFLVKIEMSAATLKTDLTKMLGSKCSVWLYLKEDENSGGGANRYFHGIITRAVAAGLVSGSYRYSLEVRPQIWLLSQFADCRIFQQDTPFNIVKTLFGELGYSDVDDRRQGGSGDQQVEYCVQYRETSLNFITRLMEQYGFYYYFRFSKDAHTLVFADDPNGHEQVSEEVPYRFDQTEFRAVDDHIWRWQVDHLVTSGKWTYRDYNFETPSADLTAKSVKEEQHNDSYEVYDFPGLYLDAGAGQRLADLRMQDVTRRRHVFLGQSNSRDLRAGLRFKLKDHPESAVNGEYLLTRSVVTVGGAEGTPNQDAQQMDTYRVDTTAIKWDVPFRLSPVTPRPVIRGPQTAKVVGSAGDEISTDKYGRIKVRFPWDRGNRPDEEASCWIRVAQSWAGPSFGAMFIPRVGMEVVVQFLEGNPDRPLITGAVYNANNMAPYALPANKTQTGWKSNSSTGGGGANELRFEDKAGSEEVYLHAQKDLTSEVKHDHSYKVLNDQTGEITQNRTVTIKSGNDKLTVSAGGHTLSVPAGKSATTAVTVEITGNTSITLTSGGSSIELNPAGVTIKATTVTINGSSAVMIN